MEKLYHYLYWTLRVVLQVSLLTLFYLAGEFVNAHTSITIPGSLIGLILLFIALEIKVVRPEWLGLGVNVLLKIMPILFVPTLVALMNYGPLFMKSGLFLMFDLVLSSLIIFFMTGWFI
ncbi:CidA/LrgA family protein [Macrococcoides caseolyticum]|uniref:CidA/LrgA family protein n=1 Tax=Macrococcoides caseolyticum TaxID=69966 RepID=UPI000C32ABA6|nr:CidA/LrgA family protein [Macrococcus caseolyticus]PKE67289.1 CidA/LrgA family protein [Macrococcus caseolyticus]